MCSIYDNLRKGLGNVSKDRCIFIFLTLLSIFAESYCCDIRHCQDLNGLFIIVNF